MSYIFPYELWCSVVVVHDREYLTLDVPPCLSKSYIYREQEVNDLKDECMDGRCSKFSEGLCLWPSFSRLVYTFSRYRSFGEIGCEKGFSVLDGERSSILVDTLSECFDVAEPNHLQLQM